MRFIDLFAGLGGFHLALSSLGHECVFASEIQPDLQELYKINFPGTNIQGDLTQINARKNIPTHDIVCGGFPCQPFSQAGKRQGFNDEANRGNLFYYICDILYAHKPKYLLLENVSNLLGHNNGNTWEVIENELKNLNYEVKAQILSPHQFGIPQHRKRVFIVGINKDYGTLDYFNFLDPESEKINECQIQSIVDETDTKIIKLKPETRKQLEIWQEFIDLTLKNNQPIPSFPIWAMEFGANYDYEGIAPAFQSLENLKGKKGTLGQTVNGATVAECLEQLPVYAKTSSEKQFPKWKKRYIALNREFYAKNSSWLDSWLEKIRTFKNSHLKFEWNCGPDATPTLYDKIIQFRASGIRVKLPNFIPALNLVGTQIPILPWVTLPSSILSEGEINTGRYLSVKEAKTLQGMGRLSFEGLTDTRQWEALGNAVNVEVVKHIAKNLLNHEE